MVLRMRLYGTDACIAFDVVATASVCECLAGVRTIDSGVLSGTYCLIVPRITRGVACCCVYGCCCLSASDANWSHTIAARSIRYGVGSTDCSMSPSHSSGGGSPNTSGSVMMSLTSREKAR